MSYEGPESFAERDAQYWASPEQAEIELDPKDYPLGTEVREIHPILGSWARRCM